MKLMEDMHGYEPSIHKEKDNKKIASCIYDWIGKESINDLGSLQGEEKVWIRGKTVHMFQKGVSLYQ